MDISELAQEYRGPNLHIGYVFIYYYGLERRLLSDGFDLAFDEVLHLRRHHFHPSFVGYATDALLHASLLKNRFDRLHHIFFPATWRGEENQNLFVAYLIGADIKPKHLMSVGQYISGINKRYLQNEPGLFESVLAGVLNNTYGKPAFPMANRYKFDELSKRGGPVFANISLPHGLRTSSDPDFYSCSAFLQEVANLFAQTHEAVKLILRQRHGR